MNRRHKSPLQSSDRTGFPPRVGRLLRCEIIPLWLCVGLCVSGCVSTTWCQSLGGSPDEGQQPQEAAPVAPGQLVESTRPSPSLAAGPCFELNLGPLQAPTLPQGTNSPVLPPTVAPCVKFQHGQVNTSSTAKLNGSVTVVLPGLNDWVRGEKKDPGQLRLYLAGRMLSDAAPALINLSQDYVNFDLKLNPDDRSLWVQIMTEARRQPSHRIPVSVGLLNEKQEPFDSAIYLAFAVYPWYTPGVLALLVALLVALIWAGARSNLLRDTVAEAPPRPGRRAFSLGRVQMAVWFYLVVAAYLYIWLITGEHNTPTASVLTLLGISAGTGLAATFVDSSKATSSGNQRAALESQKKALETRTGQIRKIEPAEGSALYNDLQEKLTELAKVEADILGLPVVAAPVSKGFVSDVLGGRDDMSFHRFQIAAWTAVLALIFVASVYADLAMPNFDPALLGLMGISSGTYLGFKFPEK